MGEPTFAERYAAFARFNPEHVKRRLDTLAHNLTVAAFGCAAFEAGRDYQYCIENAISRHDRRLARQDEWHPGCGRSAPGWTREEGR